MVRCRKCGTDMPVIPGEKYECECGLLTCDGSKYPVPAAWVTETLDDHAYAVDWWAERPAEVSLSETLRRIASEDITLAPEDEDAALVEMRRIMR